MMAPLTVKSKMSTDIFYSHLLGLLISKSGIPTQKFTSGIIRKVHCEKKLLKSIDQKIFLGSILNLVFFHRVFKNGHCLADPTLAWTNENYIIPSDY